MEELGFLLHKYGHFSLSMDTRKSKVGCEMVGSDHKFSAFSTSCKPALMLTKGSCVELVPIGLTCTHPKEGLVTFKRYLGCADSENEQANQIAGL